jgi:hypothetical protein
MIKTHQRERNGQRRRGKTRKRPQIDINDKMIKRDKSLIASRPIKDEKSRQKYSE